MLQLLWLVPLVPFAGFFILALVGPRLPRSAIAVVGVGSVGISTLLAFLVAASFLISPPSGNSFTRTLWTWIRVDGLTPAVSFYLDALSLIFVLVVAFVGFLIHVYSVEFMRGDEGYNRFFAYMNLFVGSMLTLVLADNLVLLLLGWEGVGLCSYLLIGFWYREPYNGYAARKAFVVTRVGDVALLIGIFLLFTSLDTVQIQELMQRATQQWPVGSALPVAAAALLLGGALGKSAQLPLQTWLPDAMAGPTPVSALIHAATMVTAGVYLIARAHLLFSLAPQVQLAVAIIGVTTAVYAGFSALAQPNIKRAIAYSTISQIGFMFLALGVGAWAAAVFHFMTHAFFKALMFLAAGVVILALHHEEDMFRMGGLRRQLPVAFWTFLIGAASLSAFPVVTAGFYSKELILTETWFTPVEGPALWAAGTLAALLTSIYSFRIVFLVFFGEARQRVERRPGALMELPLMVLAVLSIAAGFLDMPGVLGNVPLFSSFMSTALPATPAAQARPGVEVSLLVAASLVSLAGIFLAYLLFLHRPDLTAELVRTPWGATLHRFWRVGWGFDWVYDTLLVRPLVRIAHADRDDFVDLIYRGAAWLTRAAYQLLSWTQTGKVRWYVAVLAGGAAFLIGIGAFT